MMHYFLQVSSEDMKYAFVVSTVFYPFAGWLADVYYGRYKVVRNSMRIGLAAALTYNFMLVVCSYLYNGNCRTKEQKHMYEKVIYYGKDVIGAVGLVGMSGFQANLLQLGIDQFVDASSIEISSYICWYVWVIFLSRCFVTFTQVCQSQGLRYEELLPFFSISFFLTFSIVLDIFLNHWLIKEPVVHNPLKLIFQVLKYVWKNKHPHLRSAFTYWEDKPYSRIDLGKAKYGGPFTTEQVEDVKTFFRILLIVSVSSILLGLCLVLEAAFSVLMTHYHGGGGRYNKDSQKTATNGTYWENCYKHQAVEGLANLLMVGLIPVLEFVLYPLFRKCSLCAKFGIMYRFLLGVFLLSIYELYIMSLEAIAVSSNHNATCFLVLTDTHTHHPDAHHVKPVLMDYRWLMPSRVFSAGSMYLLVTSGIEFICAQAPYSMKGLFAGIIYCLSGVAASIALGLWLHFKVTVAIYTCGVWFYFSVFVFTFFLLCVGFGLVKWYSFRRRDENIHNEQIFAVDYFDRYNSCPRN